MTRYGLVPKKSHPELNRQIESMTIVNDIDDSGIIPLH